VNAPVDANASALSGLGAPMRRPLGAARHLPSEFYASPEAFELDKQKIFMTHWLCVGREEELKNAGDFFTRNIVGEPIIVAREGDVIVAMLNQCLHRGVEIAFGEGNARRFICPYHAWVYDVGGKLTRAPHMEGCDADLASGALPRLRTASWRGWIFINFSEQPQPFEEFIAGYEAPLWFYQTDKCQLAGKVVVDVACNWKFVAENLLDIYHVSTLHANTFGKFLKNNRFDFQYIAGGGVCFEYESAPLTTDGSKAFSMLPWVEARGLGFAGKAAIFPNMNLSARADSLRMWIIWPVSEGRTQVHIYMMLHEDSFKDPAFEEKMTRYKDYMRAIVAEDQVAVESMQRLAASGRFRPGPLSHMEGAIHHVLNRYVELVGA
jgi:phenylpropionate dioxygenase-like ring-hydroxylating dioxygenase large terminal subunit